MPEISGSGLSAADVAALIAQATATTGQGKVLYLIKGAGETWQATGG